MSPLHPSSLLVKPGLWKRTKRRIVDPILEQLRTGLTPDKIALTIAVGAVLALFPILGSTTLLCSLLAFLLRLNQPIIQLVNYLAYPAQIALLLPFYRAGEILFAKEHLPLSIPLLLERFKEGPIQFFKDFGVIALQGVSVWLLLAPPATTILYYLLRKPLRKLARQTQSPRP